MNTPPTMEEQVEEEMEEETVDEVESAVLLAFRVNSPDGSAWFMDAYEEIPSTFDISEATEVGGSNSFVTTIGESAFVYNGSGTLTKWDVDRTDLSISISGFLNLTTFGITGPVGNPVAVSDTEAYVIDNAVGRVVEFNPQTMEVEEVITFTPYQALDWLPFGTESLPFLITFQHNVGNGVIFASILSRDLTNYTAPYNAVLWVFDLNTREVRIEFDNRLNANGEFLTKSTTEDFYYLPPTYWTAFNPIYGDHDLDAIPSGQTLLRVLPNGTFDADFALDLRNSIGADFYRALPTVVGNEAVVLHWPIGTEAPTGNPFDIFDTPTVGTIINVDTEETRPFQALQSYINWVVAGTYNEENYIIGFTGSSSTEPDAILRQNSVEDYTVVLESSDAQPRVLRQLW